MRQDKGFSLLELVAVLAIFAMVALIGVQAIQASVRSSERLTEISAETRDLSVGLALLRHDLNAAAPRAYAPTEGGQLPALSAQANGFDLSVGGLTRLAPGDTGFGRVLWRFDRAQGVLTRQVAATLIEEPGPVPSTVVLTGVTEFAIESFALQSGWRPGFAPDPRNPGDLPLGLRVHLTQERAGAVTILVSLR